MAQLATVLTHPHCRHLMSYTNQLLARQATASDAAQLAAIKALWAVYYAGTLAAYPSTETLSIPQDATGHTGKHSNWLLAQAYNRASEFSEVETDLQALSVEVAAL